MTKFWAYNKLFVNGRATGTKYKAASGDTAKEARAKAEKYNCAWNKKAKGKYTSAVVAVKKQGANRKRRPQRRHSSMFSGMNFDFLR
jgi:hypothetical protein